MGKGGEYSGILVPGASVTSIKDAGTYTNVTCAGLFAVICFN